MKTCTLCKLDKDESQFWRHKRTKDGRSNRCIKCVSDRRKVLYPRRHRIIRGYGMTLEEHTKMNIDQNGVCAICHKPETAKLRDTVKSLSIDHCHQTGKVRGLLCQKCNTGLGAFQDDTELLAKASQYVTLHRNKLTE